MKKTIEQRAKEAQVKVLSELDDYLLNSSSSSSFEFGYTVGATDQRKIDIDKACEVYRNELMEIIGFFNEIGMRLCNDKLGELISFDGCIKDFRKAMEEER